MSGFEAARQTQFAHHQRKQLTDQEPVFLLVPATQTNLSHFAAKEQKWAQFRDVLFMLGACVGFTMAPVVCGVIAVGRPAKRRIGDTYECEILACLHDLVPGIREFLVDRAIRASRALGFQRLLAGNRDDERLLVSRGFEPARFQARYEEWSGWVLDLAHTGKLEGEEGPVALPPVLKPALPESTSIDV